MIKGIAHLAFRVSDIDRSVAFYEKAFGFKRKFSLDNDDGSPWLVYLQVNDNQFIELFPSSDPVDQPQSRSYQHLCIEVENIEDVAKRLVEKGIKLDEPVSLGLDNNYQCWLHDPDGNPIELMEYGRDAMQKR
jgi:catechol 2,3-dioxygenase-like lactoylglutathione lyase family enzyme